MSNHFYDQTFGLHMASDHLFLKTEEGDISHATFAATTARLSNALVAAGMSVGDRVAVQAEKSPTLLGICAANSTPRVAPHGGRQGVHGTNPLAYAVPSKGVESLVFDAATGHSAARVVAAREQGVPLEDGVLIDGSGLPSNDPEALDDGALLPVGEALGYGLGLLVDLLCGGLSNGPCGIDVPPVGDLDSPYGCSFFILAINADFFGGQQSLAERCTFLLDSLHRIAPAQGQDRVRAPGERSAR